MNTKYLLGVLLIMAALMVMPVMAFSAPFYVNSQDKGVTASFSMSMPGDGIVMPLSIGTIDATGPAITLSTNGQYSISMKDTMPVGKPAGSAGKLADTTVSAWGTAFLGSAMQCSINGGSYVPMSGADQVVKSGSAEAWTNPINLRQVVGATDVVLGTGHTYAAQFMVTGGSV